MIKEKELEILQRAINAFKENVNMNVEIETEALDIPVELDEQDKLPYRPRADGLMNIVFQQTRIRLYLEIMTKITKGDVYLKKMFHEVQHQFLMVTKYVNAQLATQFKKENIQFIDMAGNAYINQPPLYIFVKGNRLPKELLPTPVKRAFKPTGLKLIFAFLCNPGLENKPYREIAAIANVALGTVGWIMRDLKEMGYMLDMGKRGTKIIEKEKLFERWVIDYPEKLRPKLTLGKYQGAPGWWVQATLTPNHAQWGGEVAAADLTKYLKPQEATLYIDTTRLNQILLDNRLKKDPHGETEILERFWKLPKEQLNEGTVHPLLIYADLLATDNQRNIETAKMIYEQYIIRLIRED
jgi:hypothetical protein